MILNKYDIKGETYVKLDELNDLMKSERRNCMKEAHETGAPVMRTMFYEFPEDAACWDKEDQYMFGPDLLVAPIFEAKVSERKVYLPAGERWRDTGSGTVYEGGQTVTVAAPLDVIPVFCREGKDWM